VDYFSQSFFDKYCMEEKKTEGCYRVMNWDLSRHHSTHGRRNPAQWAGGYVLNGLDWSFDSKVWMLLPIARRAFSGNWGSALEVRLANWFREVGSNFIQSKRFYWSILRTCTMSN
jgi:hypothetical protein